MLNALREHAKVIGKNVSRLEMDSRWALARSVPALSAERDALKAKLERQCSTLLPLLPWEQTQIRWAETDADNPYATRGPPGMSF